jgi:hypothetical protein
MRRGVERVAEAEKSRKERIETWGPTMTMWRVGEGNGEQGGERQECKKQK